MRPRDHRDKLIETLRREIKAQDKVIALLQSERAYRQTIDVCKSRAQSDEQFRRSLLEALEDSDTDPMTDPRFVPAGMVRGPDGTLINASDGTAPATDNPEPSRGFDVSGTFLGSQG